MIDEWIVFLVGLFQVWYSPYGKVEESFNIQACHDILYHGMNLTNYDHFEFPGVVPRTFLGAIVIAFLSYPIKIILEPPKHIMQIVVRSMLWLLSFLAWRYFKRTIGSNFGRDTSIAFAFISVVQFHVIFYMGRTLPNTFALILVLLAFSFWMKKQTKVVVALFSISTIVFRGDTAVIFAPILLFLLVSRQISLVATILVGLSSTIAALSCSILVDSYFWQEWLWPEGQVLWFNTVLNKSHEWGTHPFTWYYTSAFPRILLATSLLLPLGATSLGVVISSSKSVNDMYRTLRMTSFIDWQVMQYLIPIVLYVTLFSILPHKELRFVLNAVPIFNFVSAMGLAKLWRNRQKNALPLLLACGCIIATFAGSIVFTLASNANYPGGVALNKLHVHAERYHSESIRVHIDVASATTGASRFGEIYPGWRYLKTENLNTTSEFESFDFILTEDPNHPSKRDFTILEVIQGFDRVDFRHLAILKKPFIYIMQRTKNN